MQNVHSHSLGRNRCALSQATTLTCELSHIFRCLACSARDGYCPWIHRRSSNAVQTLGPSSGSERRRSICRQRPWLRWLPTDHLVEMGADPACGANESGQFATPLGARLLGR